jgi:Erv1 / Alr family
MRSWIDMFRDTITCPNCRDHFTSLLDNYRAKYPGMLNSRNDFAAFSFRAHNDVNRRLSKPIYGTVAECMETLRKNVQYRSAKNYRMSYLTHIQRYFRTLRDSTGIAALRKIVEMFKIENDYVAPRDTNFVSDIAEANVVLPYTVLNTAPNEPVRTPIVDRAAPPLGRLRLTGAGIRIQR